MKQIFTMLLIFYISALSAQEYFPKNDGVKDKNNNYTAFTHARIYVSPTKILEDATLLIHNNRIIQTGKQISFPKNTVVINIKGKTIYPSFIDIYSDFGIEKPKAASSGYGSRPQYDSKRTGYYWNEHIMPENNALSEFSYDTKKAKELRDLGFGVVNTHIQDGIIRGNGILVALNDDGGNAERILDDRSAQYLSFKRIKAKKQVYPNSLMGSMALIRQFYYDADWYAKGYSKTKDLSIEAYNKNKDLVQIFEAGDKDNDIRADKIGDQFGINYTIVGGGNEYETVNEIKKTGTNYIIPINFPKAYDVENPYFTDYIELGDMRKWNQAPANPGILEKNQIPFALTTYGLKKSGDFMKNLRKAVKYGLGKDKALEALTLLPARFIGKNEELGTLEKGKYANFLITSGDVFDKNTIIYQNWVQGKNHSINNMDLININGDFTMKVNKHSYNLSFSGKSYKPTVKVKKDSVSLKSKATYQDNWLSFYFYEKDAFYRLTAKVKNSKTLSGIAVLPDGKEVSWTAIRKTEVQKTKQKEKQTNAPVIFPVTYPNIAYGFKEKPKQQNMLIKNTTVWTNEKEGILKNTDVLIKDGKIARIGKGLKAGNALTIDGTGKHLTSGIIDEHTHITAMTTNEVGHNSTAEVNMEDAINDDDINIYRSLAGGVTEAHILHGSANPIGGRSALIKLKWGEPSKLMIDQKAPKTIKFALGENVKQSRYPYGTNRFPQTRMGVEQVYMDYFQRAREYEAKKKSGKPYRKDIEMETLAEILNGKRFITCHSYVQSEMNMLMKVADHFGFTVNTFTHALEGYKLADKMKAHGAGGSTFSDWWAYKYEVIDAIPQNAAIMHNQGVVTAINSDDAEMIRRLNQEAAKSVKYGDISEEEAWKFVTLNPAKLLHIDDRVGSIKVGKEADVVLWTDNPLSIKARPVKTIIEGVVYFDSDRDRMMRTEIQKERNKLIEMMLQEKSKGNATQSPKKKIHRVLHCDTVEFLN